MTSIALDRAVRSFRRLRPPSAPGQLATLWRSTASTRANVWSLRPPLSRSGTAVLLLSAVAFWLGGHYGWLELRIAAVAGVGALVVASAFSVGRSRYAVALDLAGRRVVVGERAVGRVEVTSAARRRMLPARIELPVGAGLATFELPSLRSGESHEDLFVVPTTRRAVIPVGPVRSVRGDALGLMRRDLEWTDIVDLYVHPRTVPLQGSASGFLRDLEGRPTKDLSNSDISFHALRGYVPGDDRRYVHWRTSARTGNLMVRQFEETRRSHLAVALSTGRADYADPDEFELAVSVCGSLGMQALRDERNLSVLTSDAALRVVTGPRLLDDLSGVEVASGDLSIRELARHMSRDVAEASLAVLLCGSVPAIEILRIAGAHFPLDVRVVIMRAEVGAALAVRTIAGSLTVVTIGNLDDLPSALRRAGQL